LPITLSPRRGNTVVNRAMRYGIISIGLVFAVLAGLWLTGWRPPYRYNPWAAIDLRAPPDLFTGFRLHRLDARPAECLDALTASGAQYTSILDRSDANGCGWHNAVLLRGTSFAHLSRPAVVACPLAASLVLLDRHVLQPTAESMFGAGVAVLDHAGSYNCRDIEGDGRRSSHASARALDVTGFRLTNGTDITIPKDWGRPLTGDFLRTTQEKSCPFFGMILGPDYNAAHAGHFHMQAGSWGWCR
jgi:hypothetical protein